jgi:hypothetical protein
VGGVDRGNEAGARRGRGLGLGHLSRRGHRMRKPVWRVSLHPFGRLAPPFRFLFLLQSSSSSRRHLDPAAMSSIRMAEELDSVEGKLDPRGEGEEVES